MRYFLTPVRIVIINRTSNSKCRRGCGEIGTFIHYWWDYKLLQPLWKVVWSFLRKTKNWSTIWYSNPSIGYLPQRLENSYSKRYLHTDVHSSIIHSGQDMEATKVSYDRWLSRGPSMLLQMAVFHLFLRLSNIPLYICTTASLASHLS